MMSCKRLEVPLCDILLYVNEGFKVNNSGKLKAVSKDKLRASSPHSPKMERTRRQKRGREELEDSMKSKKEIKYEADYSDAEDDSEADNSFKENQENELSEFERLAQKNRAEREAFLQSLKINEIKEEFVKSVESIAKSKPKPRISTFKKHKPVDPTPLRKSRRLAKLDIDLSEQALYAKAVAEASSAENVEEKIKLKYRKLKKIHRSPLAYSKPLDVSYSKAVTKLPSTYPFEEAISTKDDCSEFINNFDFTMVDDIKYNLDYASNFKHMKIGESNVAKLVPTRITSMAIHPASDKVMVIAGSKYGHLGFWNVTSSLHPILFLPHTGGITNVKVNPYNSLQVISSSYDGTLRCGDMEKKSFNQIYDVSDETSCTYFDFVGATTLLVSQRNGNVSVIDVRNESLNSEKKHECHDYSVKTVHVHPGNKNLFLTADSKGNMKLWDLRKLQKKAIIDVCHHKRTIASAFFSPVTGKYILTTSADDSLCIFDSSNIGKEILHKKSIKHNNWTGRWLTPFKATWLPHSDELFSVGSMNYPRRIEIFNANGNNVFNFKNDEYLNSVTSINEFHPSLNVLAGGNSSGKVFIFTDTQLNY
ncbi:WD repeat-containing protein 76 isoform X3 [Parasteatoda tepidariorum]|uniref:WD repeat-containing protein 76 isoform X3 n=1 Tax=Parasteatoda tepidariorum TaxID=114398 RepID=UPI0039BD2B79